MLAIATFGGKVRELALTCEAVVYTAFLTWEELKRQLARVFSPPNHAYSVCFHFLACRQGKNKLVDYV